jgi:hypothetical protein
MSNKSYRGDIGTVIIVDCGVDISLATVRELYVKKPDGTEAVWAASLYNTNYLKYTVLSGDLTPPGVYYIQAYIVLPTWQGRGETATFTIYGEYK